MDLHRGGDHAYGKDRDVLDGGDMDREPTARDALDDGDTDRCHVSKVLDVWDDHVQGVLDE